MNPTAVSRAHEFRPQILERRARLKAASHSSSPEYINELIAEVDAALARIDEGTYGICETCHDPIEADRLHANPLMRFCLDHLSRTELQAHEQDLELANQIQSSLLPPSRLSLADWDVNYRYEPAGPVGGDYCELMVKDEGKSLFFAVGDVSGKGIAASLLMTHLSAILRSLLSLNLPLTELLHRANHIFCDGTPATHYATLVCGVATSDGIELCNAGHCTPLVLRSSGIERLDPAGLPLGMFCNAEFPVVRTRLAENDSLVLYTDGVTEAVDADGREFGAAGLMEALGRNAAGKAEAIAQGLSDDFARFRHGARPSDDLTLLVMRRQR